MKLKVDICTLREYTICMLMEGDRSMNRDLVRVNLNLPRDLVDRIDEYAKKMALTRTASMHQLVCIALETNDALHVSKQILELINEAGGLKAFQENQKLEK